MPSTKSRQQLRLRVFAGPNGSGKSTVIKTVRQAKVAKVPVDFGFYINADDIAQELQRGTYSFDPFQFQTTNKEFTAIALASGLINDSFTATRFAAAYAFRSNAVWLKEATAAERLAQIIADFLRKKLLALRQKFSFETVFSHPSKLDIMRHAAAAGYKVYLYFVSTESPEISKFRVQARVKQGGHDVPPATIESRYYRSLGLLYEACQIAYQAYFFDNSAEGEESLLFAHFKVVKEKKAWDPIEDKEVPEWFIEYYSKKV